MLEAHKNSALGQQGIMPKINTDDASLKNWQDAAAIVYKGGGVILQTDSLKQPLVTPSNKSTAAASEVVAATTESTHSIRSPGF